MCRHLSILLLSLSFLVASEGNLATAQGTRLLRNPDVSSSQIAFVHANDIWLVSRKGGEAFRLTSGQGEESDPAFSADGKWVAFTGQYGGNSDVYVVPASGGEPQRLTWHPDSDVVQGWTSDGQIMFRSGREGKPTQLWKFYQVSPEGGFPTPIALPQAYDGEMSADGKRIAYQEIGQWDPEWRNYRGGQAQPIGIVSTTNWERITPPWDGERHLSPVWLDGVVYYISERDYAANIWSFNPETKEHRQWTHHADFDVKSLGAGGGVIVYEQAGYLHLLDPRSGKARQLVINVARDMTWSHPRWEDISSGSLQHARLSPTGKRAVFETRGELITAPLEKGSWRNITLSSGIADRYPVWSPDGQQIAWFNDEGGEYGLVISDQYGKQQRRIQIPDPTFYFVPTWSPDGTRLAFTDTDYRVLILNLETEKVEHVDTDRFAHPERSMNPVWSPDSRWLAYARRLENQLRIIALYDTKEGKKHQLTDGMADSISPVWDASGKYLYFLASTDFGLNTGWLDMTSYDRPVTRALYVALLKKDTPSPFLPKSDEEPEKKDDEKKAEEEKERGKDDDSSTHSGKQSDQESERSESQSDKSASKQEDASAESVKQDDEKDKEKDKDKKQPPAVEIDFDGIQSRILDAPGLPQRNYVGLAKAPEGKVFVIESIENQPTVLHQFQLEDAEVKEFAKGVSEVVVSHDRKKMLLRSSGGWKWSDTSAPPSGGGKSLEISGLRIKVDPKAEYQQMLRDGWRFMRDFLYVDNVHGAPWDDVWQWYSPWLDDVHHRSDFNYLLDILSGEVAVGHSYVAGGDYPDLDSPRTGLLGADLEIVYGKYRIAKLYDGGNWTPGTRGPLTLPGLNVSAGDYILAINGQELTAADNIFELLEGTVGRTITLHVNSKPEVDSARQILVEPTRSENQLRTWDWVNDNQRRVDEMSNGRLAYVWLPNTGRGGYTFFNRMYFAQQDRQGAIIDERNNGGGSAADYIIEVLSRELTGYFNSRAGDRLPFKQPMAGLYGPKAMIINERAGPGGDLLPYLFRLKKLGPLVGTRTWGGLVGTWDTPRLIDGGRFVAPRGGFFDVDGKWAVEGIGVAPDIEVRNDPRPVIEGRDPQLEAAVKNVLERLKTEKVEFQPEPEPPIRYRRPEEKKEGK